MERSERFIKAVQDRNYKLTERLLKRESFDINKLCMKMPWDQGTVLHYAAYNRDTKMVELLLTHNADVNKATATFCRTPLHYAACWSDNTEIIKVLLRYNANSNIPDMLGRIALHLAVLRDNDKATELLIKHGSKVNCTDCDGDTPLHRVIYIAKTKCAQLLLQHGADLTLTNEERKTSLAVTKKNNKATAEAIKNFANGNTLPFSMKISNPFVSIFPNTDFRNEPTKPLANVPSDCTKYTLVTALRSEDKSEVIVVESGHHADQPSLIQYSKPVKKVLGPNTSLKQLSTKVSLLSFVESIPFTGKPTEVQLKDLAGDIGYEWINLAIELGMSRKQTEQIRMDPTLDPRGWITKMLMIWRENVDDKPEEERLQILKACLISVNRNDLSQSL